MPNVKSDERGLAHLGLILVVVVFVAVGALVYWRFQSSTETGGPAPTSQQAGEKSELTPELDSGLDDIEQNTQVSAEEEKVENE